MKSSDLTLGIVSPDAPPCIGGMGRHVESLAEGFRRQGVTVHLFSRSLRPLVWRVGRSIGFSLFLRRRLRRFVREYGISVLQIHAGPGGVLLPFSLDEALVIVVANHTYASQCRLPGQWWKKIFVPVERMMYSHAKHIIAISEDTGLSLQRDYGVPQDRITVVHCGFDLAPWVHADRESADRNRHACVFIGRPDIRKGWDILMEAWPIVRRSIPSATLSVVGWDDAPHDGIQFCGRVSGDKLPELLGSSSLLVSPSRLEGFGLAAAESIASGTPVIATRVAGLLRVVEDGATGLLVDVTPEAVADGIIMLLRHDRQWDRCHEACRTARHRFAFSDTVHAHMRVLSTLYS